MSDNEDIVKEILYYHKWVRPFSPFKIITTIVVILVLKLCEMFFTINWIIIFPLVLLFLFLFYLYFNMKSLKVICPSCGDQFFKGWSLSWKPKCDCCGHVVK